MREIICYLTLNVTWGGYSGHTEAKPRPLETHAVAGLSHVDVASPTPSPWVPTHKYPHEHKKRHHHILSRSWSNRGMYCTCTHDQRCGSE
jgi:hypothetical protein